MRTHLWSCIVFGALTACASHGDHSDHGNSAPPESVPIPRIAGDAVFIVNGGDASIAVLQPTTGAVLGKIQLKNVSFPHRVYMSPDRQRLSVGIPGHDLSQGHSTPQGGGHGGGEHGGHSGDKGAVLVLDANTGAMVRSRVLDSPNHNAIYSGDGREIWTALLREDGVVLVLDADTLATKQTIKVGRVPAEVTFSPDGRYAFVANGSSNDVSVIDASSKQVVKTLAVDAQPVGAWPGADGLMYVDCEVARTVKVIDPKSLEVVRSYSLGFTPGIATVPPGRTTELWLTDTDTGKVVFNQTAADARSGDVATGPGAHALAFTPDGKTAFVTNQTADTVSLVDATTRTVKLTVPVGSKPNGALYRPAN